MPQEVTNELIIEHALAGRSVVRLKGGDPFVFARGYEEVLACAEAGIPVTVVPGVTSAIAVPAMAGVPVTHRAVNHEFVVVSGHLAPDNPESLVNWDALAKLSGTLVLLMAVERGTLQHLIFDDRALWNHRAMAAVLGAILKLPPVKRALANKQVRSRYLEVLMARGRH